MWTQRDQLQAYQFLRRRLVSALQVGDANHAVSPSRRLVLGCALGTACALLLCAAFAVLGALRPGANQNWRRTGQVVIERETGALFVLGGDGLLHPVLNYASARLLAGAGSAPVTVPASALASVPRGQALGIAGAPTYLPAPSSLVSGPWATCTRAPGTTIALVGVAPAGTTVGMVLVMDDAGRRYAVVDGRRLRVADRAVLVALGVDGAPVAQVGQAWVDALPAGPDLSFVDVAGRGLAGPRVGAVATRVGQVLVAATVGAGDRYYVVRTDGLTPVSQTEAALILGNPANRVTQPVRVAAADVVAAPVGRTHMASDYPAVLPRPVTVPAGRALCAVADGVTIAANLPRAVPVPVAKRPASVAGEVYLAPGTGALVTAGGGLYLITDVGVRYPLAGTDAAKALGYGGATPVALPAATLALFPLGPALDPRAAAQPATVNS